MYIHVHSCTFMYIHVHLLCCINAVCFKTRQEEQERQKYFLGLPGFRHHAMSRLSRLSRCYALPDLVPLSHMSMIHNTHTIHTQYTLHILYRYLCIIYTLFKQTTKWTFTMNYPHSSAFAQDYILGSHWWYKCDFLAKARGPGPGYSGRFATTATGVAPIKPYMSLWHIMLGQSRLCWAVLGTCSAMGRCWAYVGPMLRHVGPMLGHVEPKFGNLADFRPP
jgi:hypothetical protein